MEPPLSWLGVFLLSYRMQIRSVVRSRGDNWWINSMQFVSDNWQYRPILKWDQLSKSFPWGVFMLQGAGLAIADAFKVHSFCTKPSLVQHFNLGIGSLKHHCHLSSFHRWGSSNSHYSCCYHNQCYFYWIHKQSCLCHRSVSHLGEHRKQNLSVSIDFEISIYKSVGENCKYSSSTSHFTVLHVCFTLVHATDR